MKLANVSEENGGPLSVERVLGGPYCEISGLTLSITGSAAFEVTLYRKGYLQNVSAMRR